MGVLSHCFSVSQRTTQDDFRTTFYHSALLNIDESIVMFLWALDLVSTWSKRLRKRLIGSFSPKISSCPEHIFSKMIQWNKTYDVTKHGSLKHGLDTHHPFYQACFISRTPGGFGRIRTPGESWFLSLPEISKAMIATSGKWCYTNRGKGYKFY